MYIIDRDYFIRELQIPNLSEMNSASLTELNLFIDGEARPVLLDAIGFVNLTDLESDMTDGELNVDAAQKWKNLVDGCTYEKDGVNVHWQGLRFESGTFKGSLLANYVFCKWLEDQVTTMTGTGEKTIAAKNAEAANSTQRYVKAWNKFVVMYQGANCSSPSRYIVRGIPFTDYFGGQSQEISLLTFLSDNETEYPDCPMRRYEPMNQMGL